MASEGSDSAMFESRFDLFQGRVGIHHVATLLEEFCIFKAVYLDFATNILSSLTPFQLDDDFIAILVDHILGNSVTRVFHVKLNQHATIAIEIALIGINAPFKFRCLVNFALLDHSGLIDTDDIFTDDNRKSHGGCAYGEGLPIFGGNEGRAQGASQQWNTASRLVFASKFGFDAYVGKSAVVL